MLKILYLRHVFNLRIELEEFLVKGSFADLMKGSIGFLVHHCIYKLPDKREGREGFRKMLSPVHTVANWAERGGGFDTEWLKDLNGVYVCDDGEALPEHVKPQHSAVEMLAVYGIYLITGEIGPLGAIPDEDADERPLNLEQAIEHRAACLIYAYQALSFCYRLSKGGVLTSSEIAQAAAVDFSAFGSLGGLAKDALSMGPLRIWAITKYHEKEWANPRQAAKHLEKPVIEHGKSIGVSFWGDSPFARIYHWFLKNPPTAK